MKSFFLLIVELTACQQTFVDDIYNLVTNEAKHQKGRNSCQSARLKLNKIMIRRSLTHVGENTYTKKVEDGIQACRCQDLTCSPFNRVFSVDN